MLPGLELDKLDASISVRNLPDRQFYAWSFTVAGVSWVDKTVTLWFRPKYLHVLSIYDWWLNGRSESFITDDWTTTKVVTRYVKYNVEEEFSLWEWDQDTVQSIYIERDATRHRYYFTEILSNWVKFVLDSEWAAPPDIAVHIFAIWQ